MALTSILVVEDDKDLRGVICRALRAVGHGVEESADATLASSIVQAESPALLITDIVMPDGVELIGQTKRAFPGMKILAISGGGSLHGLDLLKIAAMLGADPAQAASRLRRVAGIAALGRR